MFVRLAAVLLMFTSCQTAPIVGGLPHPLAMKESRGPGAARSAALQPLLMLGSGPIYLSLLPVAGEGRDLQVLLEVALSKPSVDVEALYRDDRRLTGEKTYTLVPERVALGEVLAPPRSLGRKSFHAALVRGDPESGGRVFVAGVVVTVLRVVYAKQLAPQVSGITVRPQYLLFGSAEQLFAVHLLASPEDFDLVASVRITAGVTSEAQAEQLRRAARVALSEDQPQALSPGTTVDGEATVAGRKLPVSLETLGLLSGPTF